MPIHQQADWARRLSTDIAGELYSDAFTRGRYATDASIYQMMPAGVVIPRTVADISTTI